MKTPRKRAQRFPKDDAQPEGRGSAPRSPGPEKDSLDCLISFSRELSSARSLAELMVAVRNAVRQLTGADGATFVLREGDLCHYADEDAVGPLWMGSRFPMDACISGWVMKEKKPAVIEDIYADERIPQDLYPPTFVKSLVMMPIRSADPIGAIGVYWAERHRPGDGEVKIIQALAESTAVALGNLQLLEELARSAGEVRDFLETLVKTSESLILVCDPGGRITLFNRACEELSGYAREEVLGKTVLELFQGASRPSPGGRGFVHPFDPCLRLPQLHSWKTRSGEERLIEWRCSFLPHPEDDEPRSHSFEPLPSGSERFFQLLFEEAPLPYQSLDETGCFLHVNRAWLERLGYALEEVLGRNFAEFLAPQSLDRFKENFPRFKALGEVHGVEFDMVRKDGSVMQVSFNGKVARDIEGNFIRTHCIFEDITERKRAQEEKRRQQDVLSRVFRASPYIMMLVDREGRVLKINRAGLEFSGRSEGELLGLSGGQVLNCIHAHTAPVCNRSPACGDCLIRNRMLHSFQTGESTFDTECSLRIRKGATEGVMDMLLSTTLVKNGGTDTVLLTIADITERKRNERRLREYEKVVESLDEMIAVVDRDYRYLIANRAFMKNRAPGTGEVLGRPIPEILGEEMFEEIVRERLDECFRGKVVRYEMQCPHPGVGVRDLSITYHPVEGPGGVDRAACIMRDVTEQRRGEEEKKKLRDQLYQTQKLEAIGTLAGGIAHDFNNILGIILGFAEIALGEHAERGLASGALDQIVKATHRARELVKQILTFSRRTQQDRRLVQVSSLVKEALKMLRASLPTTIEIRSDLQGQGMVNADPVQIHQIIMNLCTNSYHAMRPHGGVLTVGLADVEFGERTPHPDLPNGAYMRLTVRDTGSGIDPAILDRIFDPFFTTKDLAEGTGMGLSVVHGIVKSYGGVVTVESEPGKGSTFTVYLPRVQAQPGKHLEKLRPALPGGKERILFVDDETLLAELSAKMLSALGYQVVTEASSPAALELFQREPHRFDLVITDLTMPQMTGDELARRMMEIRRDVPVILCTGYGEMITREQAQTMGIRELLLKPLSRDDLALTVRNVLDGIAAGSQRRGDLSD